MIKIIFNSIEECIAYIEKSISKCMRDISDEIKHIMDDVTREQVRGWSGQIFSSVVSDNGSNFASAEFQDTGRWYSLLNPNMEVGNPIKFLEAGTTWNRSPSNIMDVALSRCEEEIPQLFLQLMQNMGIPIQ